MFSAQTIMSADAWGALPARSSSFQDRNGKECSAYCLRINDGSTVWDYEGWLKNLDGNNAVFCEAGDRIISCTSSADQLQHHGATCMAAAAASTKMPKGQLYECMYCLAGSCSIMLNVKTRPGWSCSPMAEDMYLKNTKRLKMSGHIFFNLVRYRVKQHCCGT